MAGFQFKQFYVSHDRSSMKVGTDGVLLGRVAKSEHPERILEVGTGCGVIALELAQRYQAKIDAIDIDAPSVEEAAVNFSQSPWNARLTATLSSLQEFGAGREACYDMIVSNPPFFSNSLKAAEGRRSQARHNDTLSYSDLLLYSRQLLESNGGLWVILPLEESRKLEELAKKYGFALHYEMLIHPKPGKDANRRIMGLGNPVKGIIQYPEHLTIRQNNGNFTSQYQALMVDFYLHF